MASTVLDTFTGAAGAFGPHVPDIAPAGASWTNYVGSLVLDGLGYVRLGSGTDAGAYLSAVPIPNYGLNATRWAEWDVDWGSAVASGNPFFALYLDFNSDGGNWSFASVGYLTPTDAQLDSHVVSSSAGLHKVRAEFDESLNVVRVYYDNALLYTLAATFPVSSTTATANLTIRFADNIRPAANSGRYSRVEMDMSTTPPVVPVFWTSFIGAREVV